MIMIALDFSSCIEITNTNTNKDSRDENMEPGTGLVHVPEL